jgi:rubrerythrin
MQGYQCDRCDFFAHSPYLVCALHPAGPEEQPCRDFESAELWQTERPEDYRDQHMEDFFWHPLFTGRCPDCGYIFSRMKLPPLLWRCPACGWEDDTF